MGFFVAFHPAVLEPSEASIRFTKTFRLRRNAEQKAEALRADGFECEVLEGRAPRVSA